MPPFNNTTGKVTGSGNSKSGGHHGGTPMGGATSSGNSSTSEPPRVAVPDATLRVDDKILLLSPGMLATVEIKTGSRTLMEYMLSPVMKATDEAGRER